MRARALLAAALVACGPLASPAAAAGPSLEVALEPSSCTIGDPVEATLVLRLDAADAGQPVAFPAWGESWGELAVLESGAVERRPGSGGGVEHRQRLRVAAYTVGAVEAPAVSVRVGALPVRSEPARLEIRSVLPPGEPDPEPKPPADPRRLPLPAAFWIVAGLLAAGVVAAIWRLRRRGPAAAAPARLPPLEELERALGRLAALEPARGHAELSLALRRFLERSCEVPAPAWSTSELARRLVRRELEGSLVQRGVRLLRDIDAIKFARQPADGEALERRVGEAREVARTVEARLHPPPPPPPPKASEAAA
jgi:hypothetical protein